jgi:hypothetical protein
MTAAICRYHTRRIRPRRPVLRRPAGARRARRLTRRPHGPGLVSPGSLQQIFCVTPHGRGTRGGAWALPADGAPGRRPRRGRRPPRLDAPLASSPSGRGALRNAAFSRPRSPPLCDRVRHLWNETARRWTVGAGRPHTRIAPGAGRMDPHATRAAPGAGRTDPARTRAAPGAGRHGSCAGTGCPGAGGTDPARARAAPARAARIPRGRGLLSVQEARSWTGRGLLSVQEARSWTGRGLLSVREARSWTGRGLLSVQEARSWTGHGLLSAREALPARDAARIARTGRLPAPKAAAPRSRARCPHALQRAVGAVRARPHELTRHSWRASLPAPKACRNASRQRVLHG